MKKITVKENQTIYDIAIEQYGTCEAVGEILFDNSELLNDEQAKRDLGIDPINDKAFYFDIALKRGYTLLIDTDSCLVKKNILRDIMNKEITTFDYGTDN
jgi:hypothetical protein bfra3_06992|nr:MAG TPA: hypothetical protein [Caudoviricetes sp.]